MVAHGGDEPTTLAPDAAFAVLGNEVRMDILRTLWDADDPVGFADLRGRVGIADSSRFNYHLGKLVGHFVRKTDAGYELRSAGEQVIRSVLAGAITQRPSFGPTALEARCPYCGSEVESWYDDDRFTARCTDCPGLTESEAYPPGTFMQYHIPPGGVIHRDPDEVLEVAHVFYDAKLTAILDGVCPECAASVRFDFDICPDHELPEDGLCETCGTRPNVWINPVCDNCQYSRLFPSWFAVVNHPAAIAFHFEQGVPWDRVPFSKLTWENMAHVGDIEEEVRAVDPLELRVSFRAEHESIHLTLDDALHVIDVTWE